MDRRAVAERLLLGDDPMGTLAAETGKAIEEMFAHALTQIRADRERHRKMAAAAKEQNEMVATLQRDMERRLAYLRTGS